MLSSITLNQTKFISFTNKIETGVWHFREGDKVSGFEKTKLVLWDALTWQFCDSVICSRTVGGVRCLSGVCGFSFSAHQTPHCVQNYSLHTLHMLPFDAVLKVGRAH